jgi:hypothetical protein
VQIPSVIQLHHQHDSEMSPGGWGDVMLTLLKPSLSQVSVIIFIVGNFVTLMPIVFYTFIFGWIADI